MNSSIKWDSKCIYEIENVCLTDDDKHISTAEVRLNFCLCEAVTRIQSQEVSHLEFTESFWPAVSSDELALAAHWCT